MQDSAWGLITMRQDFGEFVTVYDHGTPYRIMVDIAGAEEDRVYWLNVKDARKLAEELTRAADACERED